MTDARPPVPPELERIARYLALDPDNVPLRMTAVDVCMARGRADLALAHAEHAVRAHPDDPHVRHAQGLALLALGRMSEAEALFQALLSEHADGAIAYNLALACFGQRRYEEALAAVQPYVSDACDAGMLVLCLRCLHHLGRLSVAVGLARTHMARLSSDGVFLGVASLVFLDAELLQEVARTSAAALVTDGRPYEAVVTAGSLALGRDDAVAARSLFEEALARAPMDGRALAGLGMTAMLEGDFGQAKQLLERAAARMPTHIGTRHALGWCELMRGDAASAEQVFRNALEIDRNFGESHGGLATALALQGRATEAKESIERALRLDAQGLAARYAELVLSGAAADPREFNRQAARLLSSRRLIDGGTLADIVMHRR